MTEEIKEDIKKYIQDKDRMRLKYLKFSTMSKLIVECQKIERYLQSLFPHYLVSIRAIGGRPFRDCSIVHICIDIYSGEVVDHTDNGGGLYHKHDHWTIYPEGYLSKTQKKYKKIDTGISRLNIPVSIIEDGVKQANLNQFKIESRK